MDEHVYASVNLKNVAVVSSDVSYFHFICVSVSKGFEGVYEHTFRFESEDHVGPLV